MYNASSLQGPMRVFARSLRLPPVLPSWPRPTRARRSVAFCKLVYSPYLRKWPFDAEIIRTDKRLEYLIVYVSYLTRGEGFHWCLCKCAGMHLMRVWLIFNHRAHERHGFIWLCSWSTLLFCRHLFLGRRCHNLVGFFIFSLPLPHRTLWDYLILYGERSPNRGLGLHYLTE